MLSDFDLAKQSGVSGGRPATIHQSEPNGVSSGVSTYTHPSIHPSISWNVILTQTLTDLVRSIELSDTYD